MKSTDFWTPDLKYLGIFIFGILYFPATVLAEWTVIQQETPDTGSGTTIAYTKNDSGYTLEIYRDSVDAIRSRFTLINGLTKLADRSCPTYQIDKGMSINRSLNDAPCITNAQWAEFILGHVNNGQVSSSTLLALMDGISIRFRFILANGDYRETNFSLQGSKRAMTIAFGQNIVVTTSQ